MNLTSLKDILGRKFEGSSLDDIQGISDYSLFKEAAVNVLSRIDPQETLRYSSLSVFKDVYDYSPPTDLKDVADIKPQTASRSDTDNATKRYLEGFDQDKNQDDFTLEWRDGSKVLRYSKDVGNVITLHGMDSLTGDGTWDGSAANIVLDEENPYKGSGSIRADFDTGEYIENDDFDAIDLSDHENKSMIFLSGYFPDASLVTSIELRWGSSSTVYFSRTVTVPQFGSFRNGWNLIPFNWNGATETGTVDTENINFLRIIPTLSSSDTDIKFDNVFSALPQVRDLVYYSSYLFRSSAGTFKETPTDDTDIVNLDIEAENIYIYECCQLIAEQLTRPDDSQKYYNKLHGTNQMTGLYDHYNKRKPGEAIKPQSAWRKFGYKKK